VRRLFAVAASMVGAGLLTALVFVVRAGGEGEANWPTNWELRSSDNGVLFQLLQDVAAGRVLDWNFSPQVYVFPELPVSALAFLVAGGDVYIYYLLVAALNNAILFGALYLVVRLLWSDEGVRAHLARASIAFLPLVALPLVGTAWLFSYHLAPTYYFGMYLVLLGAPALFLVRTWPARVTVGIAIALTAASNPLVLVFAVPALVLVGILVWVREGFVAVRRPALVSVGVLMLAFVIRVAAFAPLQGTSPLDYINVERFGERLDALRVYLEWFVSDDSRRVVLVAAVLAAVACLGGAILVGVRYLRRGGSRSRAAVWFGLVPLSGLAGTAVLLITHTLYLWPVLVAPLVFVLLAVRRAWLPWFVGVGALGMVVLLVGTGGITNLATTDRYFGHRSEETRCLDERVPEGAEVGYATFSDARRLALTSQRGIRLIPLKSDGMQADWLANTDYLHADVGHFFYLNPSGDEAEIDRDFISREFGQPDAVIRCDEERELWVYEDATKLDAIANHYGVRQN
jgi:hypothetical protein